MAVSVFFACENNTEFEEEIVNSEFVSDVEVVNGVLCFDSRSSIEELSKSIGSKSFYELSIWEDEIGFNSIEKRSAELMDEIACRADQFVADGYTQQEVLAKYDSGELEELTPGIQADIERLKLDYSKDENGIRLMRNPLRTQYSLRFLNENYEIVIADTLYQFSENEIKIFPYFSAIVKGEKVEPIIARIFKEETELNLKDSRLSTDDNTLCHDFYEDSDHRLEASFVASRIIYQKTGCTSNCIRTDVYAYIYYQGYYRGWFNWRAGNYNVDAWCGFDVSYNNNGVEYGPYAQDESRYSQTSSPIQLYVLWNLDNSEYPWIAIGNVDCGGVDMGGPIECMWNQSSGCWGVDNGDGYCPMYQMGNTY